MKPAAALLVLLSLLVAGCASSPVATNATRSNGGAADAAPGAQPGSASGLAPARFPTLPFSDSVWMNGTLSPQDARRAPGAPVGSPAPAKLVSLDVSKIVPKGIPVILVGDAKAAMSQGSVRIFFSAPDGEMRNNARSRERGGTQHVESGIVHASDGPVMLNLFYDEAEPGTEAAFTLSARVESDPAVVRAAFPVGVTVPAGTRSIGIELVGERRTWAFDLDTPNLMAWGSDDAFLGHHALTDPTTTLDLPDDKGGEVVLLLSQGGRSFRVLAPANATLRAMPQSFTLGPEKVGSPQKAEWESTYDKVPVLAGVQFVPTTASSTVHVKVESRLGALFDDAADGPWLNVALPTGNGLTTVFGWDGGYGIPQLSDGKYRATITLDNAAGSDPIRARDFSASWSR